MSHDSWKTTEPDREPAPGEHRAYDEACDCEECQHEVCASLVAANQRLLADVVKRDEQLAAAKRQAAQLRAELEHATVTKRTLLRRAFDAGADWDEATVTPPFDTRAADEAFDAFYGELGRGD